MACCAAPVSCVRAPAQETPSRRGRRRVPPIGSSLTYRDCAAMPCRRVGVLYRFPHRDHVRGSLHEPSPLYRRALPQSAEYSRLLTERFPRRETQQQLRAALGAWMLGQKQNARLSSFRSGPVTEPRRERYTSHSLRREIAHIQNDGTETASLQQQV